KAGANPKTASYDDIGNLSSKSDLAVGGTGIYTYPTPGAGSVRPHAVSSISGTVNGTVNPEYKYDADGNLTCIYTGVSCSGQGTIFESNTWTSYDMSLKVTQGTSSVKFTYDSEHARVLQHFVNGSTTADTTYLNDPVTGTMSEMLVSGGTTTWH